MLTDPEATALSAVDYDALSRSIETCRQKDPATCAQIERMLATELWRDVAEFASFSCQSDALRLRPWQPPPVWVDNLVANFQAGDDGVGGDYAAAKLLQRLLDAGLSRYEPDPVNALEARKRPKKKKRLE